MVTSKAHINPPSPIEELIEKYFGSGAEVPSNPPELRKTYMKDATASLLEYITKVIHETQEELDHCTDDMVIYPDKLKQRFGIEK